MSLDGSPVRRRRDEGLSLGDDVMDSRLAMLVPVSKSRSSEDCEDNCPDGRSGTAVLRLRGGG